MSRTISEVMTTDPVTMSESETLVTAAQAMREADIGDVIVMRNDEVCGIVTDRDIVVRSIADAKDPNVERLGDICSSDLASVGPDDDVEHAVELMRERALRRLPVLEAGRPVGIVSIGDLALDRDRTSALADISAAPANT